MQTRSIGACPEEGHKDNQRMEQIFYEDRVGWLRLFSLEIKRPQREPVTPSSTYQGPVRELGRDFLPGHVVTGQEGMAFS